MGDLFKKQQAKNFQRGRDRAMLEAAMPRLFDRPDYFRTKLTVHPLNGDKYTVGEQVLALIDDANGPVKVVRGYQKIGTIEGDGADILKQAILKPDGPHTARLRVMEVSEISGTANAEIVSTEGL